MKFKSLIKIVGVILSVSTGIAYASNLMDVYNDALQNDPTFKRAEAVWQSDKQNLGIAWSGYLPQVNVTAGAFRQYQRTFPRNLVNLDGYNNLYQYQVTASQPIFNAPNWFNIRGAQASVKAATAQFSLSAQDLMVRTAVAYFNVLKAYDLLQTTIATKQAFYREYITAQQKFKVGLIAITAVYEAQAQYDQSVADEITNRNTLYNRIEDLRAITRKHYANLNGLGQQVPLIVPAPNNINTWVMTAEQQNYTLIADLFFVKAAHENIHQQATGALPQINAVAQYGQVLTEDHKRGLFDRTENEDGQVGVSMLFPIIQGGRVIYTTRQAAYDFAAQGAQLEFDHRTIVNNTRQSFLGTVTGIAQIKADKQAIISGKNALQATQAGYSVGTRTILDVLNEVTNLAQATQRYYDDQYNYIVNIINLKFAAGTLSPDDLAQINSWLNKNFNFNLPSRLFSENNIVALPLHLATHKHCCMKAHSIVVAANPHEAPSHRVLVVPHPHGVPPHEVPSHKVVVVPHEHAKPHKLVVLEKPSSQPIYALQLFSSVDDKHAVSFIKAHPKLKKNLYIIRVGRYYKVLYGKYKTPNEAKAAEARLQHDLQLTGVKPWIISVAH